MPSTHYTRLAGSSPDASSASLPSPALSPRPSLYYEKRRASASTFLKASAALTLSFITLASFFFLVPHTHGPIPVDAVVTQPTTSINGTATASNATSPLDGLRDMVAQTQGFYARDWPLHLGPSIKGPCQARMTMM